jgi:hypothetical protein
MLENTAKLPRREERVRDYKNRDPLALSLFQELKHARIDELNLSLYLKLNAFGDVGKLS